MERLCPLCRQIGQQYKISVYPLNQYESVEMCENELCTWPVGDKSFGFIPTVNDIMKELVEKHKNHSVIPMSTELSLYTPPVTPVDNQETNVKGNNPITDSYASQSPVVKDIQILGDRSRSIFDIDSPEKANNTSNITTKTDEKQLGVSKNNLVGKCKFQPTVLSSEFVSSIKILEKVPVRKLIIRKGKKPAIKKVNMSVVPLTKNVNCLISDANYKFDSTMEKVIPIDSTSSNIIVDLPIISDMSVVPLTENINSLNSPKNISDNNYNFGSAMEKIMSIDSTSNNIIIDLPVISNNTYSLTDIDVIKQEEIKKEKDIDNCNLKNNVNNSSSDVDFIKQEEIKQEEINLESIIEDLKSGNTNNQVDIDEEWLTSFLM